MEQKQFDICTIKGYFIMFYNVVLLETARLNVFGSLEIPSFHRGWTLTHYAFDLSLFPERKSFEDSKISAEKL